VRIVEAGYAHLMTQPP